MVRYVYHKIKILQDRQRTYKHRIEARSRNHRCSGEAVLHILSVCL